MPGEGVHVRSAALGDLPGIVDLLETVAADKLGFRRSGILRGHYLRRNGELRDAIQMQLDLRGR